MKTRNWFRFAPTAVKVLCFLTLGSSLAHSQSVPFTIGMWYPSNGQSYGAPATIGVHAWVIDSNVAQTVQYFSGATSIGLVTNAANLLLTNTSSSNPFFLSWSNVAVGTYTLTAVARDSAGLMATSAPVNISVTNVPPPVVRPAVYIYSPTNSAMYLAPVNLTLYARAVESAGTVQTVQFFSGSTSLGVVPNSSQVVASNLSTAPLFPLVWSNVLAGSYALKAVATDANGNSATSSVVNISVVTNFPPPPNVPFVASIWYPANGQGFLAPANIYVHASVTDSNVVQTVQYFSGATSIGLVTNTAALLLTNATSSNPFYVTWTNVPAGNYTLTAVARDSAGITATSGPVNISVTNAPPPVVRPSVYIYSPTNGASYLAPANLTLYARAAESTGTVQTVQFFAGSTSLGIVPNSSQVVVSNLSTAPLFPLAWSNVLAGSYALKAVATDANGNSATSSVVNISVVTNFPPPPNVPFVVNIWYPTNGQGFLAPASIYVHASVADSNVVQTVQYFSEATSIGIVTNTAALLLTNLTSSNPFYLTWTNIPAGNYTLTAVAKDSAGITATSAPVNISVANVPPPIVPFVVSMWYPMDGAGYAAPANIGMRARVTDSNVVQTVQFFSGATSLGIVTNTGGALLTNSTSLNPFYLLWRNVPAGNYTLTVVAGDTAGIMATSAPVHISVTKPPPPIVPFVVGMWYPTNGQIFVAPANIGVHAWVTDSNMVQTVQYFAGTASIGIVTNTAGVLLTNSTSSNPFFLLWSNVPVGDYTLTAVATDSAGHTAASAPINIYVVSNLPPVVSIYAPDPVAVEGTNYSNWFTPGTSFTNYCSGTNTATFLIRRDSGTNAALTVYYSVGGTASNGVDYATIPDYVTIPAGQRYALITIVPLNDTDSAYRRYDTVVLALSMPTSVPLPYSLGSPQRAGAVILEENFLPIQQPTIRNSADSSIHVSLPATNGMNFSLQISTDLVNWLPVCTNTVLKGSAQFVDPNGGTNPRVFYRIVPSASPPSY